MRNRSFRRRSLFQAAGAATVLTATSTLGLATPAAASPAVSYNNPLISQRADPHIVRHSDGYYYFTASVPEYNRIVMRRATTLQGLASAQEVTVWWKHSSGPMSHHIWAPEIHYIDGAWYIHFAAGRAEDIWRIRMYVLRNTSSNPMTGGWTEMGQVITPRDSFSLDATTFEHNGTRYLCWAQSDPDLGSGTSLYLAAMSNPWTITGQPVRISMPTHSWERIGHNVNEGAYVIKRNGRIFMTYSASATDANYAVGLLTASQNANLLNPSSWSKNSQPIFQSHDATSQYGPGHNCFTVSEDGQSDILVYHARPYKNINGDPLYDPNRHTRIQKVYWNADGTPNLGIPVADGPTPHRFAAHGGAGFLNHYENRARVGDPAMLADSQFRIVSGLAGSGTVSLQSANFPDRYLRHRNYEFWLDPNDGSGLFASNASFYQRNGLADPSGVSFEVPGDGSGERVRYEVEDAPAVCDGTIGTNHAGYSGSGFCDTPNTIGAYAQFTVTAASAGQATVEIGFANGSSGGARGADVVVNGTTTGSTSFEVTGSWSSWSTKTLTVPLNEGDNTIRLVATGSGGLPNIDYLDYFTPPPPPVRYEVEDAPAVCDGTIDTNHAGYSGSGFCNTPNTIGAYSQFTVTAASAGQATVEIGFANGSSGDARGADVVVNGTTTGSTTFEVTGGWSSWSTKTLTVPLNEGDNTIRLVATGSGGLPNIDYLDYFSENFPSYYLRRSGGLVYLDTISSDSDQSEATFFLE